jgi:hypothetical protein
MPTVPDPSRGEQRKLLDEIRPRMAKADRKPLADLRPVIGRLVDRALVLADISKQVASADMGYADQATVSRWCSGVERPAFDKLFTLPGFEVAWVLAIAERNKGQIEATTVITIRRIA